MMKLQDQDVPQLCMPARPCCGVQDGNSMHARIALTGVHARTALTGLERGTGGRASVSLEPRKGTCCAEASSARMHSFSASRLLLISAPSSRVCLRARSTVGGGRGSP